MQQRECIKLRPSPLMDLLWAKSISLILKTKAALGLLALSSTLTYTSHLPSAHSTVPCCYLGDVMCHFSLKALSQNSLFHQSSRRRVFPSKTKNRAARVLPPGWLTLSLGTRQRRHHHKGDIHTVQSKVQRWRKECKEWGMLLGRSRECSDGGSFCLSQIFCVFTDVTLLSCLHISLSSPTKTMEKKKKTALLCFSDKTLAANTKSVNIQHISE